MVPSPFWIAPFATLLLCIALLPLIPTTAHWWEHNRNKLLLSVLLAAITLVYYYGRGFGIAHDGHATAPGWETVAVVLEHALLADYVPFIVLLFSLYTISGGIRVQGNIPATPRTNTAILALGAGLASFIGTTGASMLLIRPLLEINRERRLVAHTVIFFIFLVSNVGGCLLPLGDPPLFLGYLRGVPFTWTLCLWKEWLLLSGLLLAIYFVWDQIAYRHEADRDRKLDEITYQPLHVCGRMNFLWLLGVILAVAFLIPEQPLLGTRWIVPPFLREGLLLLLTLGSWISTDQILRRENEFNFYAISEVACLFIGIFICMQVPVELLQTYGAELGLREPWQFFWATGLLSSFLDNAPTYAVYFETAGALQASNMEVLRQVHTASGTIPILLLKAISLGAVFMGAVTYIGNGPNFMVKSIAEQAGVRMPSFFGYMLYSGLVLLPALVLITWLFLP